MQTNNSIRENKITQEMIYDLNYYLYNNHCIFKFKLNDNQSARVVPANDQFILSANIILSNDFIDYLKNYFKKYGIYIIFDNDSCSLKVS